MEISSLDPVTQANGWSLIYYNNKLGIKKNNSYYSLTSVYNYKGQPVLENSQSLQYLGEFRPVYLDTPFFAELPIVVNSHKFFVNQKTNIAYIRPMDLVIIIPNKLPYNIELYNSFTFGGTYNTYLNSTATSTKNFVDIIPKHVYKKPIPPVPQPRSNTTDPFENTLTQYPKPVKNIPDIPLKPKQDIPFIQNSFIITFIIPFIHSKNENSLVKTVKSIREHVKESRIIIITNHPKDVDPNEPIPKSIADMVYNFNYNRYVGRLGVENLLNIKMKNTYDVCSFYNFLFSNYVKTELYTIWNYNWEIKKWDVKRQQNITFNVPNYYHLNDNLYRSTKYGKIGYVLTYKTRYQNTLDGQDVTVNGVGPECYEPNIIVQANFDSVDFEERKNMLLYGNEIDMRYFFQNKDIEKIDNIEKIIV
jgi:hypothetical protein